MANKGIKCTLVFSSVLVIICSFSPAASLRHHVAKCEAVKPCVCEFPSGDGIDLSVLSNPNKTLSANMTGNATVYFQPCDLIGVKNISTCNLASLCVFNSTNNQTTVLGNVSDFTFLSENLVQPVQLQFVYADITSTVDLSCPESGNETSFSGNKESDKIFRFTLKSPAACIKQLEIHPARNMMSVLLISALIVLCTYFIAMIIVRHSRGAVGWEVLPHYDFCIRIPNMCRTGFISVLSCCRLQPSYEQI